MDEAGIFAMESVYLERYIQIGAVGDKILNVTFPNAPDDDARSDHAVLDRLVRYLEGDRDDFEDVEVALTVPTRHRSILEALRSVPYGEQVTVERLAAMTPDLDPENEDHLDLVREALDENPAPILIPDHRVRDGPSAAPPEVEQKLRSLEGL